MSFSMLVFSTRVFRVFLVCCYLVARVFGEFFNAAADGIQHVSGGCLPAQVKRGHTQNAMV